jgi:hypothetical protein
MLIEFVVFTNDHSRLERGMPCLPSSAPMLGTVHFSPKACVGVYTATKFHAEDIRSLRCLFKKTSSLALGQGCIENPFRLDFLLDEAIQGFQANFVSEGDDTDSIVKSKGMNAFFNVTTRGGIGKGLFQRRGRTC